MCKRGGERQLCFHTSDRYTCRPRSLKVTLEMENLWTRPYLKHQQSGAALWSRRHPHSTSLSWGYLSESLCRSHNWRWSGCSPDRQSERVRPGQPWLPVYHTIARITSPSEEKLRLDESTRWPLFSLCVRSPASESSVRVSQINLATDVFFYPSIRPPPTLSVVMAQPPKTSTKLPPFVVTF